MKNFHKCMNCDEIIHIDYLEKCADGFLCTYCIEIEIIAEQLHKRLKPRYTSPLYT